MRANPGILQIITASVLFLVAMAGPALGQPEPPAVDPVLQDLPITSALYDVATEPGAEKATGFAASQVGSVARVLIERHDASGHHWRGYTDNYLRVTLPATSDATGHFVAVERDAECVDQLRQPTS